MYIYIQKWLSQNTAFIQKHNVCLSGYILTILELSLQVNVKFSVTACKWSHHIVPLLLSVCALVWFPASTSLPFLMPKVFIEKNKNLITLRGAGKGQARQLILSPFVEMKYNNLLYWNSYYYETGLQQRFSTGGLQLENRVVELYWLSFDCFFLADF